MKKNKVWIVKYGMNGIDENESADSISKKEAARNALQVEKEDHTFQSEKRFDTFLRF